MEIWQNTWRYLKLIRSRELALVVLDCFHGTMTPRGALVR